MKINVLMSTYNGEQFLDEQINSILNQEISTVAEVNLIVRDDGSSDKTTEILEKYKEEGKLVWYKGENLRVAKSFWHLLCNCPEADYYAFCDQDDFWFPTKLARAVKTIECHSARDNPFLYCGEVAVTDKDLNVITDKLMPSKHTTDFAHSLTSSLAPGCTFVFNDAARKQLIRYDMEKHYPLIHDWLAHKIIAMLGTVVFDNEPCMYYRQHGNNVIGAQRSSVKFFFQRVKRFLSLKDSETDRSNSAKALLEVYKDDITPRQFELLDMVANYKTNRKLRRKLKREKAFKVRFLTDFYFRCLVTLRKI